MLQSKLWRRVDACVQLASVRSWEQPAMPLGVSGLPGTERDAGGLHHAWGAPPAPHRAMASWRNLSASAVLQWGEAPTQLVFLESSGDGLLVWVGFRKKIKGKWEWCKGKTVMETRLRFESALPFLATRPCAEGIQNNLVSLSWFGWETRR